MKREKRHYQRCWTCLYAPGGHPWHAGQTRPEPKLWCGVGRRLVGRSDGEDCSEWVLCRFPKHVMENGEHG
jgi:hypothetical protein